MSSFNQIRKYRIAIKRPIDMSDIVNEMNTMVDKNKNKEGKPNLDNRNGVVASMLKPVMLRVERLLSEGSKKLLQCGSVMNISVESRIKTEMIA